ncbi:MAG: TRAP transporter substrate-binding protein [Lachnospiraceae bacterium]|nr:TRAP transporter substrate-binding protein [Lachnospiraceae bacterium]
MKKLISVVMVLLLVLSLVACGNKPVQTTEAPGNQGETQKPAETQTDLPKMTMKMHMNCGTSDYVYTAGEKFAELVSQKTNGKVTVELYPNSALGTSAECIEGLAAGVCNIVFDPIDNYAAWSEIANINPAPYLYSGIEHYRKVWEGEVGRKILDAIGEQSGKILLGAGLQGVRIMTTTKPIKTVEDVKGLKLRVPTSSMYIETWAWLGATPTPISASEAFTAIQQGTCEGQENPYGASVGLSMYECCKYVTETNHVYGTDSFGFDKTYFNNLPAEYQKALREAAEEACKYLTDLAIEQTAEKKQVFVDAGCEIIETDVSQWMAAMDGFFAAKFPYLDEYVKMIQEVDPKK